MGIKSVEIQNFKSIKNSGKIELGNINVLVGANGSGKSNFIEFFNFLKNIAYEKLFGYTRQNKSLEKDGVDNILHFGKKKSNHLSGKISFYCDNDSYCVGNTVLENNGIKEDIYIFDLLLDKDNKFVFNREEGFCIKKDGSSNNYQIDFNMKSGTETSLRTESNDYNNEKRNKYILAYINLLKIYHFNDTSITSNMKSSSIINKNQLFLKEDGSDIASFVYNFSKEYPKDFKRLEYVIKSVAPFFEKFYLIPEEDEIYLRWMENDENSTIFPIGCLSDGTLRFICLASILLCPLKPMTIFLDEPELGLHPFAIAKLAGLIRVASKDSQIILSTQSADLINEFSADDIIIVERKDNETIFKRQSEKNLENWIKDYSMGEIWCSNIIGGNP